MCNNPNNSEIWSQHWSQCPRATDLGWWGDAANTNFKMALNWILFHFWLEITAVTQYFKVLIFGAVSSYSQWFHCVLLATFFIFPSFWQQSSFFCQSAIRQFSVALLYRQCTFVLPESNFISNRESTSSLSCGKRGLLKILPFLMNIH